MANAQKSNVLIVDTSAQFAGTYYIKAIKYVGAGTTPTATIKADSTSGTVVWEDAAVTTTFNQVCINIKDGMYVTLAGTGTKLYIYLA
jgi:hypothetical protein